MNREDIIRMAWQAYDDPTYGFDQMELDDLERFAALVAAREREAIIEILSRTEFTSLDHMPHEATLIIRLRGQA